MSKEKDLVVYVADGMMENAFQRFFQRSEVKDKLKPLVPFVTRKFNDPGDGALRKNCGEWLRPYSKAQYALVVIDEQASHPARKKIEKIKSEMKGRMIENGWAEDRCEIVVISPELEAWLWQKDNGAITDAFGFATWEELEEAIREEKIEITEKKKIKGNKQKVSRTTKTGGELWAAVNSNTGKPKHPKELFRLTAKVSKVPGISWSVVWAGEVARHVQYKNCKDPNFAAMWHTLTCWSAGGVCDTSNRAPC